MKNNVEISIIVPTFNVEKYINECLDTLLDQTYKNYEIIVVDDGSSDNTINILNEYKKNHSNIKLIQQENQFAGVARNNGMKYAQGKYLLFLDSDDFFELNMLEKIYNKAIESEADVVLFNGDYFNDNENKFMPEKNHIFIDLIPKNKDLFNKHDTQNLFQIAKAATWNKFIKKELVIKNDIHFSETKTSNDVYFSYLVLTHSDKITYVYDQLLHYRVDNNSLQNNLTSENINSLNVLYDTYLELIKRKLYIPNIEKTFKNAVVSNVDLNINRLKNHHEKMEFLKKLVKHEINKEGLLNQPLDIYLDFNKIKNRAKKIKDMIYASEWIEQYLEKEYKTNYDILENNNYDKNPAISIVIPVYNTSQFVKECIDSIINQTFKDIEIICVNDGSSDNSLDILKNYLDKDTVFKIVTYQDNKGLSYARNVGIKQASGEYIYTIDSDDFLELNGLELLYKKAKEDDLDTLFFDARNFYENKQMKDKFSKKFENRYIRKFTYNKVYTGLEILDKFSKNNEYLVNVPFQLIKRSFFLENDLWFIKGIVHEDDFYTFKSMINAKRVSHLKESFYNRRFRDNSIMTSEVSFYNIYSYFINYQLMRKALDSFDRENFNCSSILKITNKIIKIIRQNYPKLSDREKEIFKYLDFTFRMEFQYIIVDYCKKESELEKNKKKLNKFQKNIFFRLIRKISRK